jgi:broad specificity phosphatase PhoE
VARRWPLEWSVWRTAPETLDLDGRETLTALYARVADAFDDLVRSSDAATVVVFTHDAVVRAAVAWKRSPSALASRSLIGDAYPTTERR